MNSGYRPASPPLGWSPPIASQSQSLPPPIGSTPVGATIPPPIGWTSVTIHGNYQMPPPIGSRPVEPPLPPKINPVSEIYSTPVNDSAAGARFAPPIGGTATTVHGAYYIPPPIGSSPVGVPLPPATGSSPGGILPPPLGSSGTGLSSQPIPPPLGANPVYEPLPPAKGWSPPVY